MGSTGAPVLKILRKVARLRPLQKKIPDTPARRICTKVRSTQVHSGTHDVVSIDREKAEAGIRAIAALNIMDLADDLKFP
jgi:hypothetical protein